jgi:hypothetical protein
MDWLHLGGGASTRIALAPDVVCLYWYLIFGAATVLSMESCLNLDEAMIPHNTPAAS